jgi:hypothetical protein
MFVEKFYKITKHCMTQKTFILFFAIWGKITEFYADFKSVEVFRKKLPLKKVIICQKLLPNGDVEKILIYYIT